MHAPFKAVRLGQTLCGRGVFSLLAFEHREIIAVIQGTLIDDPQYESDYGMAVGDDCLEPTTPFCYLNHCCDPNCDWFVTRSMEHGALADDPQHRYKRAGDKGDSKGKQDADDRNQDEASAPDPIILLRAIKEIRPGDELTIDYSWPAGTAIPCLCQSEHCRGWVVAEDELADVAAALADQAAV